MTKELEKLLKADSCLQEWREKTTYCLMAIGMPENGIIHAITGKWDKCPTSALKEYCRQHFLSYNEVKNIIR